VTKPPAEMRCLFLMEKYCDSNPACGPTLGEHVFVNSVRAGGQVTDIKRFYYDEVLKQFGRADMQAMLYETCQIYLPDLVIHTPLGGALGLSMNPEEAILKKITALHIPVLMVVPDASPGCWPDKKIPYCSYLGIIDSLATYRFYRHIPNVLLMYSAMDPGTFYDRKIPRDIDVSFVGSVDPTDVTWPQRHEYLTFLQESGIKVKVAGGQRGGRLEPWQMCDIYNRSKISLNFCRNGGGRVQIKGRVFEVTSCGAMLMESAGTEVTEFFTPDKEMVVFDSKEDLLRLVRHYLKKDKERAAIAQAGLEKATDMFNAWNAWGYIFERMGFPIPDFLETNTSCKAHRRWMKNLETR
jgi:hypothetical protein